MLRRNKRRRRFASPERAQTFEFLVLRVVLDRLSVSVQKIDRFDSCPVLNDLQRRLMDTSLNHTYSSTMITKDALGV